MNERLDILKQLSDALHQSATPVSERKGIFFKTAPGEYAAHDQFIGVPVPKLRQFAKTWRTLSLEQVTILLQSPFNEERLLALFILIDRYQKGDQTIKQVIYDLYRQHMAHINNWNLVDASAHLIVGAHLYQSDRSALLTWSQSNNIWERRIAIVATWYFIRRDEFDWTIKIAEVLLHDHHDLIHKAVGWMLRESGKRDQQVLLDFLEAHAHHMPRTMLRYAIEKLSLTERQDYLMRKKRHFSNT